jgi:ADP-ribose pyrophosphatase YjhB (NUDIX family)
MEKKILELFLFNNRLRFIEIEKALEIRSNKLSYYLKSLVKKNKLEKEGDFYKLRDSYESFIPYLTDKKSIIPVVLIFIKKNKNNVFLIKRQKRPFFGMLSLPGGRMLVGDSLNDSVKRISKKYDFSAEFVRLNSINLEHVVKEGKIIHSFLLFFVICKTKEKLIFTDICKNKKDIITSDYKLILNDLYKRFNLEVILTEVF